MRCSLGGHGSAKRPVDTLKIPMNSHDRVTRINTLSLYLFTFLIANSARSAIVVTPGNSVKVPVGATLKFHSNVPVKWSLLPGSVGSIDSDGTYHAPASITVSNKMGGCQILPNDSIYNTRVDSLPLRPESRDWISRLPASGVGYFPAWGINIADEHTPTRKLHFMYTPQNDGAYEFVPWPKLKRENGVFSDPLSGLDRHVLTVNRHDCNVYEIYNDYPVGVNKSCGNCTAQSGTHYVSTTTYLPHAATDAGGLYLAPLTLRLQEVRAGAIRHALRMTLDNNFISPTHVWPATANAGPYGRIPYGTRFRLRASFDISRFSPVAKVLLTQLKEYGLVLADGGANWEVDGATDLTEDFGVWGAMGEAGGAVRGSDFEIVDESRLLMSPDSGQVNPENGYVKPDSFAVVIATDERNPAQVSRVSVAIEGVTVGIPEESVWIQSGVTKHLESWVNGTSNKAVIWSMEPQLGKLTSEGIYTAPNVDRPATTTLTVASAADRSAKTILALTVMPAGGIRIDIGNASGAPGVPNRSAPDYGPDSHGHMWWREQGGEIGWGVAFDESAGNSWPKLPDIGLYYTRRYSFNDMTYRFAVPNGNYKITLMFATGCHGKFGMNSVPMRLEAQGQIVVPEYDYGRNIDYACNTPSVETMPATATDNDLYFSIRRVTHGSNMASPMLNAFSIEGDSSPGHLGLYPSPAPDAETGSKTQFNAIGWYMSNAVTWSVSGPGSITPTGLYVAPAVPPGSDEAVIVTARSTVNASQSVSEKFVFKSGSLVLSPASALLQRGLSQQFKATMGSAGYSNLHWDISPHVGSINAEGLYTAPDELSKDTDVTITARSIQNSSKSGMAMVKVKAIPDPIRINCGDQGGFKDAHGNVWSSDYGFSPSIGYNMYGVPIAHAPDDLQYLYRSSRYVYENQGFSYDFAVPNGRYAVTLMFADYGHTQGGTYQFNVKIDGAQVLSKFDPDAEYGARSAVDKTFQTVATKKAIHIEFFGVKGGALVNGIQLAYVGPS